MNDTCQDCGEPSEYTIFYYIKNRVGCLLNTSYYCEKCFDSARTNHNFDVLRFCQNEFVEVSER